MRVSTRPLAVLAAACVLALSGCGDDGADSTGEDSGGTASESSHTDHDEGDHTDHGSAEDDNTGDDGAAEVEVEIEGGQTKPAGERITVAPGQTIRLEVDSDAHDELHVHADPDHTFEVAAADDQVFEFAIDQPGVYEMESHETGNQIISIQVQP